ncbi:PEPxxWA-CTERM sorting domain-containing protein [Sphingomonas sp. dw_22]|uniref:PEPxxWA-CTERM sorting domain-containing protein n=1 Tax=Sphingomonas sp. dw_22 TaxID=2721175 RepID=UPI0021169E3A|nr:PEPxxWA-CTERM sorting domain-containing protein [Sphingomonas sp. dw_22]
MKKIAYTIGLLAAAVSASGADATPTSRQYTFTAHLPSGPTPIVTGGFTLLQDPATQTASLLDIDFTIGSTVYTTANATLVPWGSGSQLFMLYGNLNGSSIRGTTEDFWLHFNPFDGTMADLYYSQQGYAAVQAMGSAVTLQAVPEPAAWGMMILGFGLIGGVLRRRVRASEVRYTQIA